MDFPVDIELLRGKKGLVVEIANEQSIAADCATGLVSDYACSVTANVSYIDAGYHIMS